MVDNHLDETIKILDNHFGKDVRSIIETYICFKCEWGRKEELNKLKKCFGCAMKERNRFMSPFIVMMGGLSYE